MMLINRKGSTEALRGPHQFLRFCAVGAVGFCVDAGLLETILWTGMLGALTGRFLSFACAVLVTFELNRRWSFKGSRPEPFWPTFGTYLGVQGFGFCCNFTIYSTLYILMPPPLNRPLVCLVIASACALTVNFLGARLLVFRATRTPGD